MRVAVGLGVGGNGITSGGRSGNCSGADLKAACNPPGGITGAAVHWMNALNAPDFRAFNGIPIGFPTHACAACNWLMYGSSPVVVHTLAIPNASGFQSPSLVVVVGRTSFCTASR